MKRLSLPIVLVGLIYAASSCLETAVQTPNPTATATESGARQDETTRQCATMDVLAEKIKEDNGLAKKLDDIEEHTKKFAKAQSDAGPIAPMVSLTIPVAVHVLYYTARENISLAQIQSQVDVLNKDFSKTNPDVSSLPSQFSSLATNMDIQFTLDPADIDRKASSKASWGTRDAMKSAKKGGINPKDPSKYLNIWVCNIGGGILGYAQFPGGSAATDGVVIGPQYFGNTGYVATPFDKGRTATHEIGHWLNLRHIWGDANCGNDLVADTPTQQTSNYGCPSFPHVTCSNGPNGDLFMNYMDYTDDACMYMFTNGQKTRSQAIFAAGGPRRSFVTQ